MGGGGCQCDDNRVFVGKDMSGPSRDDGMGG